MYLRAGFFSQRKYLLVDILIVVNLALGLLIIATFIMSKIFPATLVYPHDMGEQFTFVVRGPNLYTFMAHHQLLDIHRFICWAYVISVGGLGIAAVFCTV